MPTPHPVRRAIFLTTALALWTPVFAADATPLSPDPIPQVVRVRMAETAKGGEVRDYAVAQHEGQSVYTAKLTDPITGERSLITVGQDGKLISVLPVEAHSGDEAPKTPVPAPIPDPNHIQDPPTRLDGKDADPATRRGREDAKTP